MRRDPEVEALRERISELEEQLEAAEGERRFMEQRALDAQRRMQELARQYVAEFIAGSAPFQDSEPATQQPEGEA